MVRHKPELAHPHPARLATALRIGWAELVDFPDFGLTGIRAKIDTGAATSALSATAVAERNADDGSIWVDFDFHAFVGTKSAIRPVRCSALLIGHRPVRSSNGRREIRPVIETTISLGTMIWAGEFTLTNRRSMRFPMLIGRRALRRGFVVDCSRRWLLGRPDMKETL